MPKTATKKPPKTALPKPQKGKLTTLKLAELVLDPQCQAREKGLSTDHVEDIRKALSDGKKLPPVRVYQLPDGRKLLTDGFHTYEAHRLEKRAVIRAHVFTGDYDDARLDGAGANQGHLGLKRSPEDKRRAVRIVVSVHPDWTDRKIELQTGVSAKTIADERSKLASGAEIPHLNVRTGVDGKDYHQAPKAPEPVMSAPAAPSAAGVEAGDWRAVPLAEFLKAEDWVWQALGDAGVSLAGETLDRILKGDSLGLGRGDLDNLRTELEHLRAANEPADPVCQAPAAAPPEPKAGPVVRDAKKRVVPAALAERFAERRQFYKDSREVLKQLLDAVREERKEPESAALRVTDIEAAAAKIDLVLEEFTPYVVCPHVQPTGLHPFKNRCLVCKGTNFVQAGAYIALTAELKQIVAEWAGRGAA